jgi:predicted DNA-binding transcriptional regulator AlpA
MSSDFQKPNNHDIIILCVKDVAEYLGKSPSWVYANYKLLGGVKVEGSMFFPSKEKIYERLFRQEEEMVEVRIPLPEAKVHEIGLRDEKRSIGGRSRKKKGGEKSEKDGINRHGLFGVGQL